MLPTRLFGNEAGTLDFVQHKKRCGLYNKLMKIPGTPKMVQPFLAVFTAVGLVVGILAKLTGYDGWASLTWAVVTVARACAYRRAFGRVCAITSRGWSARSWPPA